jgi:hypothetical protein
MAKSVFQAGKEKKERRRVFKSKAETDEFVKQLRKLEIEAGAGYDEPKAQDRSVFKKGREKAERRKEFTKEAKKAGKKAGNRRITKDVKEGGTLKRGRRVGQTAGKDSDDKSKAQLYKEVMAIKKASKGEIKGNMGAMNKKELQAFILKHS